MEEFAANDLEACVRRHLPEADAAIVFAPIPTGKFNSSYFVQAGEQELVLRVAPPEDAVFLFYERRMMRQEPGLHQLLRRETTAPVPHILAFDDTHAIIDRDFLLMERLPGGPLSDAPGVDAAKVLRQVGECLAQVHRLTAKEYGYLGEHQPMPPQPDWGAAFEVMWGKLIDDIAATGHYDPDDCRRMLARLERHRSCFDHSPPAALLHMDVWGQNILVDDAGTLTGLVDWDRALWGDPEIEFAVLDYCGISQPAFWQGYGGPRDMSPEARIRQVFYLLYELQKYIVIRHGRSRDPAAAQSYKTQAVRLAEETLA